MNYRDIHPMGATAAPKGRWSEIIADPAYIAERKFDGSRYILQHLADGDHLCSRRESVSGGMVEKSENVPQIIEAGKPLPVDTVLDGEVDLYDVRDFHMVQTIMGSLPERAITIQTSDASKMLHYKVFDILYYAGKDLRDLPWYKRQEYLDKVFAENITAPAIIRVPVYRAVNKREFLEAEIKAGGEGIMLKRVESTYHEGKKPAGQWYKFKKTSTFDGIVTGYKLGKGKYAGMLGALQVKQYTTANMVLDEVAWVGGMTDPQRVEFKATLDRGETFIIEFEAQEAYGTNARYRHPRFKRVRTDKNPQECIYGEGNG